jgi:hypothetical protein
MKRSLISDSGTPGDWYTRDWPSPKHRCCGMCGEQVKAKEGNRKCDGWFWHYSCWLRFLRA